MAKSLLTLDQAQLRDFARQPETGMGVHVVETSRGLVAVIGDGRALLLYQDQNRYDVYDLLAGEPIPSQSTIATLQVTRFLASRAAMTSSLAIVPGYGGSWGALPLIATAVLGVPTRFYRYFHMNVDPRYIGGDLTAGTYLTTFLDRSYANSGFAAVGRFALPLPLPASYVFEYELDPLVNIKVGTVAPLFGQSGGGVEVQLPAREKAKLIATHPIAPF